MRGVPPLQIKGGTPGKPEKAAETAALRSAGVPPALGDFAFDDD
jgi:hypothetical protein